MRDRFLHPASPSLTKVFFYFVLFCFAGASLFVLFQAKPKSKTEKTENPIPPIQKPSATQKIQHFEAKLKTSDPLDWTLMFQLPWGEKAPAVGGRGYDPGSGNGVSGGAMPLELRVDSKGDLYLADGYGPRMLQFSNTGRLQKVLEWDFLRPLHFSSSPALCGYRWAVDYLGRWHILDTEKRQIHCYDQNGQWIKTHSIDKFFNDRFMIHDVHPVLQVAGKDLYFLQVTLSSLDESPKAGMNQIPVLSYQQQGIWLNVCEGDYQLTEISYLPFVYGLDAWSISKDIDQAFIVQHETLLNLEWTVDKKWTLKDYISQGGDLIGIDHQGILYLWSGPRQIVCLDTLQHRYQIWDLPQAQVYHPVAVHPQGGLVLCAASDNFISFYRIVSQTN
jgi:hypothetical protein